MEKKILDNLINRYPELDECSSQILDAYILLVNCFESGHKVLIAGNGGSCSDAEHIVGELMKGFLNKREVNAAFKEALVSIDKNVGDILCDKLQVGLPAIALSNHSSLNTALINDVENGGELIFAQQLFNYGLKDDVFLAISTSGNSADIYNACVVARAKGLKIIGLTGADGGKLNNICDALIKVPYYETYLIQERHLPVYHCICQMLEEHFFN